MQIAAASCAGWSPAGFSNLPSLTPCAARCLTEWTEQQEDPNVERLWEDDWDDDDVTDDFSNQLKGQLAQ